MSTSVTLPALGESVTEGTVSRWLKQVGDTVAEDEPLLEVSTDKVDTEIPSPTAGVLLEIKAAEDETVEVGAVLAVIGSAEEAGSGSGGTDAPAGEPAAEPELRRDDADAEIEAEDPTPVSAGTTGEGPGSNAATPQSTDADVRRPQSDAPAGGGPAEGTEVRLPALGESVTEGTVTRWLKQVGDEVAADEPLLEVSTDKVDTEIPSPAAGTLLEIRVAEDESVEVGAVLAVIGDKSAAPAAPAEPAAAEPAPAEPAQQTAPPKVEPGQQAAQAAPSDTKPAPPSFSDADRSRLGGGSSPAPQDPQPEQHGPARTAGAVAGGRRLRGLRDPAGPQARPRARRRPQHRDRHRRRGPRPQAGRARRRRGRQAGRGGGRRAGRRTARRRSRPRPPRRPGSRRRRRAGRPAEQPARHDREDVAAALDHRAPDARVPAGRRPA